ncbi:MAG TPA: M23 family metallopeptidase [Anaerolineaceae bacterium]|nr:M23 family metallopeptidase [Anaerolineaceae bacterium]
MPTALPTATPTPTARPDPVVFLPTSVVAEPAPADCDSDFCLYPVPDLLAAPVALIGDSFIDLTYPFGSTQDGLREIHIGVEFQQAHGVPVTAAAPGTVVFAGDDSQVLVGVRKNLYGNLVVVEHAAAGQAESLYTLYAHLSSVLVTVGDPVETGTVLGQVGASGAATGSHLHFEVRQGSNEPAAALNPLLYLSLPAGRETTHGRIVGAIVDASGSPAADLDIVLQPVPAGATPPARNVYLTTYAPGVSASPNWQENIASGNLPAGEYRFTVIHAGQLYERILPVEPGSVTYLNLQLGE